MKPQTAPGLAPQEGPPRLTRDRAVATITLRRPSRRNSLREEDLHTLLDHLAQVDADASIGTLLLTADTRGQPGPVFCAGYDVDGFDAPGHDPRLFERVADAIEAARPVTVCAMNGSAYGGATDLVLACDLRVALAGVEWRMPACMLGLHFYPGGLQRYVSRLGLNLAKHAFLTAEPMPVEMLQCVHLFARIAPAASFDDAVQDVVRRLGQLAPLALQTTKRSLNEIAAGRPDEAAMHTREAMSIASADFAEGRAAMRHRRKPRFTGC